MAVLLLQMRGWSSDHLVSVQPGSEATQNVARVVLRQLPAIDLLVVFFILEVK